MAAYKCEIQLILRRQILLLTTEAECLATQETKTETEMNVLKIRLTAVLAEIDDLQNQLEFIKATVANEYRHQA